MIFVNRLPSLDVLRESFSYDPETGYLTRLKTNSKRPLTGKRAGSLHSSGYREVNLNHKKYKEHRIIYSLYYGVELLPDEEIDHINGNPSDNRIINLRKVNRQGNCQNRCLPKNNTSGVRGVHYDERQKKWRVRITHNNKRILIGDYTNLEEARIAREQAERDYNFKGR